MVESEIDLYRGETGKGSAACHLHGRVARHCTMAICELSNRHMFAMMAMVWITICLPHGNGMD